MNGAAIKVTVLHDLTNEDGSPRGALLLPASSAATARRPVLLLFGSVAAALAAKRDIESRPHG